MASIQEVTRKNKKTAFKFFAYLGRDQNNKQITKTTTWYPPEGLTPAKARAMAKKTAEEWEKNILQNVSAEQPIEEKARRVETDFVEFAKEVWFPIRVKGENRAPKTIAYYEYLLNILTEHFGGKTIQEISVIDIERYLVYLRTSFPNPSIKWCTNVNWCSNRKMLFIDVIIFCVVLSCS